MGGGDDEIACSGREVSYGLNRECLWAESFRLKFL
jgi:hypothetical protein